MSLVLAVSFLSFVGVSNDIANGMLAKQDPELRRLLDRSGYDLEPGDTTVGSSPKQRWLVILSLLVCVVGIVNAQLMAVTERFREIGTMKCLGALDRFILRLFVLEAGMQGLVGAGVGALIGAAFSLLNGWLRFGLVSLTSISLGSLAVSDPDCHRRWLSAEPAGGSLSGPGRGQNATRGSDAGGAVVSDDRDGKQMSEDRRQRAE